MSSALEPRIVRVTAEGDVAALFGVGCEPGNQVIADFDETVGDRIFALGDVNQLVGKLMLLQSKGQSSASGLKPAKRPIAIAGTKSARSRTREGFGFRQGQNSGLRDLLTRLLDSTGRSSSATRRSISNDS